LKIADCREVMRCSSFPNCDAPVLAGGAGGVSARWSFDMKITEVTAMLMSCPLQEPLRLPFWGGERTILKRDAMLIRVKADNGLIGYAPGPAHERAADEIRNAISPFLQGQDPRRWEAFAFHGDPEICKTYRAVEIALIDLAARYEGCPLSELIGGRKRDRIKLYGSAGMYMSPHRFAEEAAAIAGMGFSATNAPRARAGTGSRNGAPHAGGCRTGFRPDGGCPLLVANGRQELPF